MMLGGPPGASVVTILRNGKEQGYPCRRLPPQGGPHFR